LADGENCIVELNHPVDGSDILGSRKPLENHSGRAADNSSGTALRQLLVFDQADQGCTSDLTKILLRNSGKNVRALFTALGLTKGARGATADLAGDFFGISIHVSHCFSRFVDSHAIRMFLS